jgi:4-hydroxy-tetrahydrodipicolinate reductase
MDKVIKIVINGAFGKMGSLALETLQQYPAFEIVATLGRNDDLKQNLKHFTPDVVLDLTRADCIYNNCLIYLEHKTKFVIGTSGLTSTQISHIQDVCRKESIGGLIVPNFSIGSVLCTYFSKIAAKWFDGVDILEMHHHQKIDSPSGTAIHTAEAIHNAKSEWPMVNTNPQPGREYYVHQIPIHSIRMPGLLAIQQILFGQIGETVSLNHQIIDRKAYMPGVKLACEKVIFLNELIIGLEPWLLN